MNRTTNDAKERATYEAHRDWLQRNLADPEFRRWLLEQMGGHATTHVNQAGWWVPLVPEKETE